MSSDIAIKVENLSKLYQLGEVGTGTISKDLNRWWARVRGKEDPYAKLGQVNDRAKKVDSEFVWSLKDINFEVKKGEVLGIIGKNGAGKSTLLKILSKITSPTKGKIYTNGRIASLLEVGTGFHPEMTGRENIYLNGAILGMRKWEIEKKFDEIVDFAGVEAYIDTPVKRYSSGMYVRLAFAVAAFLEPEILIVDEVLAVGDAEFQRKCLGRMKDVSVNDGRTVLFVSHNMFAVNKLCTKTLLLTKGEILSYGQTDQIIKTYFNVSINNKISPNGYYSFLDHPTKTIKNIGITSVQLYSNNEKTSILQTGANVVFIFQYSINFFLKEPVLGIVIRDMEGLNYIGINNRHTGDILFLNEQDGTIKIEFLEFKLCKEQTYICDIFFGDKEDNFDIIIEAFTFDVSNSYLSNKKIDEGINLFFDTKVVFKT